MHDDAAHSSTPEQPLVLYDGQCGFCSASVRFVLRHERAPILHFAPLQGETAASILARSGLPADIGHSTMVVATADRFLVRSDAVIAIMKNMSGPWPLLAVIAAIIPRPLRDAVYNQVARHRGRLPHADSCELLPPHQQKRFLP